MHTNINHKFKKPFNIIILVVVSIVILLSIFSIFNLDFISNGPAITGKLGIDTITSAVNQNSEQDNKNMATSDSQNDNLPEKTDEGVYIIYNPVSSEIILDILELKQASEDKDIILIADLFTKLDNKFEEISDPIIISSWVQITNCVYDFNCADKIYIDLIDDVSVNYYNQDNVIHKIIETTNLWNGKHTTSFSKKLTQTNTIISVYNNQQIKDKWQKLIDCNGECSSFNSYILDLIELIVE